MEWGGSLTSFFEKKGKAGATSQKGLISHKCYPYWVRQSVMHRDGWIQTNGWALMEP
jgi:hypothetical protein